MQHEHRLRVKTKRSASPPHHSPDFCLYLNLTVSLPALFCPATHSGLTWRSVVIYPALLCDTFWVFVCFTILRELRCNGQVFYRNVPQSGFVWCFSHDSPGVMGWGQSPTGLSTLSCHIRGHKACVVSLGMLS